MAHIPGDDITELWNETRDHTWKALHKTLEAHKGKAEGIDNALVLDMLHIVDGFEQQGKPFPTSQQQLSDELNAQLHH